MGLIIPKGTRVRLQLLWDDRSYRHGVAGFDMPVDSVVREWGSVVTVEAAISEGNDRLRVLKVEKKDLVAEAPRGILKVNRLPLI